jgi:hypothetical protein
MVDWLYMIKNKHLRRLAALALMVAMTTWFWLRLRPLGYSYLQVFFGWLVVSLAADRVYIAWRDWQRQRFYKAHTQ